MTTTVGRTTWLTDYLETWAAGAGTAIAALPAARAAKTFKALETAFGREDVLARWQMAWQSTPPDRRRFLTPESFARCYGDYVPLQFDVFGFVVVAPEQLTLAETLEGLLSGSSAAAFRVRKELGVSETFPVSSLILNQYERLRGYHNSALRYHEEAIRQRRLKYPSPAFDRLIAHFGP